MKIEVGKKFYFLKWKDYSPTYNTWEPEENVICPQETLDNVEKEYFKKRKAPPEPPLKKSKTHTTANTEHDDSGTLGSTHSLSSNNGEDEELDATVQIEEPGPEAEEILEILEVEELPNLLKYMYLWVRGTQENLICPPDILKRVEKEYSKKRKAPPVNSSPVVSQSPLNKLKTNTTPTSNLSKIPPNSVYAELLVTRQTGLKYELVSVNYEGEVVYSTCQSVHSRT
ncbi:PREDICTED: chromobox protein homolog 2-like [Amphimedon queenslandica]|uniref:Chromo domain-containing protein n=1 Tax=Amphimedon queenslandica TaxID=400682 RepID=A0A1X7TJC9_AMPQE|nr:PREDICTED: chromobox protein homolog 2-like [Amphimedon queenslandica]|eukprot:XP_011407449.1 PREDICTED: chromobox protein homolog 2-like [Amphimedon queenslandica]